MVRKSFFIGMAAVIGVAGIFMLSPGCSKDDEEDPASKIIGHWAGVTDTQSGGAIHPDTFAVDMNFPDAANYTLTRTWVKYASSGTPQVDSIRETGTWAIDGDNVVLTSVMCWIKVSWDATLVPDSSCTGSPSPKTIPIAISNNQWTFDMVEWKNAVDTISYTAIKQ